MTKSHFATGCLSLSALVLFVGIVILVSFESKQATASGMIDRGGTYTLATGRLSTSNEIVYLVDSKTNKLAVYKINESNKQLMLTDVKLLDDSKPKAGGRRP